MSDLAGKPVREFSASTEELLRRLTAALVAHQFFTAEDAVRVASDIVGAGHRSVAAAALASQPLDGSELRMVEIIALFKAMLDDLGRTVPEVEEQGWGRARWIATTMLEGNLPPGPGAFELWRLWQDCGTPSDELTTMLEFHEAWEQSVGEARRLLEGEILAFAPQVVAAADRHLAVD